MIKAALSVTALLLAGTAAAQSAENANAALDAIADRRVALQIAFNPPSAYNLGVPVPEHRRWPDRRPAAIADFQQQNDTILAGLRRVDASALSPGRQAIHAALVESIEAEQGNRICRFELWNVNHMFGWHLGMLGNVARDQPVATAQERADALARWSSLPAFIDQEIANARLGLSQGYSAPKAVVERVIKQFTALSTAAPEKLPFYGPAARSNDAQFTAQFRDVLAGPVRAAFTRYLEFMKSEYLPRARDALGVAANPNGTACYSASLRSYTTLPRSPQDVFALGRQTVAANAEKVRELGRKQFGSNDLKFVVDGIAKAPDNQFKSEQELIDFSREIVGRARVASTRLFRTMPPQEMKVEPFEAFRRGTGGSSYYESQIDPKLPAFYRINSEKWATDTRGSAEIVAVHEGYPGHHMQNVYASSAGNHPVSKMLFNSAYAEGWARYSEALAEEAAIYRTPYALMTRRLWPARGMVADPGLHVMGWTRQQVVDFLCQSGKYCGQEGNDLVDRMAIVPGQLTAYDSGGLEIMALRREAETALGPRFDVRDFHHVVLETGAVPLTALRARVTAWIAAEKAKAR